jgi:hypothetical protein
MLVFKFCFQEWFAERVDRILLLFDAHKLDISDEFKRSIEALRGHDDKIRFWFILNVLNFKTFLFSKIINKKFILFLQIVNFMNANCMHYYF